MSPIRPNRSSLNDFFCEPEIIASLEENLYLFLKRLYIDAGVATFSEETASLVIQSIILLSMPSPNEVYVSREEETNRARWMTHLASWLLLPHREEIRVAVRIERALEERAGSVA